MDDFYQDQSPETLYIAPDCGLKIKYDTQKYNTEFGLEYTVLNIEDFPLTSTPKEIRGWLSPMRAVTLPVDKKELAGIPSKATRFSYVYPPRGLADYIVWSSMSPSNHCKGTAQCYDNKWALPYVASFGAFAYFDDNYKLLGVNAISLRQTSYELDFAGPFVATDKAYREICDLNRYQSLYLDVFGEAGFIGSAWMDSMEDEFIDYQVEGQSNIQNNHGGLLYFRHDKTALIFLVNGAIEYETPPHGVGSMILDAFRLCKHELQHKSLSTTCASTQQKKDKIHRACQDGSKEHLSYFLNMQGTRQRTKLLEQDSFGWTPLHYACCYHAQDVELIEILLDACPDAASVTNNNDLYPLHLACQHNPSVEVIKMLLKHDKNKETIKKKSRHHGFLLIHFACSNSKTSTEVIRCLIPADSEDSEVITPVYRKGRLGWTPLQRAIAENHNEDVIELL